MNIDVAKLILQRKVKIYGNDYSAIKDYLS